MILRSSNNCRPVLILESSDNCPILWSREVLIQFVVSTCFLGGWDNRPKVFLLEYSEVPSTTNEYFCLSFRRFRQRPTGNTIWVRKDWDSHQKDLLLESWELQNCPTLLVFKGSNNCRPLLILRNSKNLAIILVLCKNFGRDLWSWEVLKHKSFEKSLKVKYWFFWEPIFFGENFSVIVPAEELSTTRLFDWNQNLGFRTVVFEKIKNFRKNVVKWKIWLSGRS